MTWTESVSPSFRARHESEHAAEVERVLELLERTRERLAGLFAEPVGGVTVVFHRSPLLLDLAHPLRRVGWLMTDPAARRYIAGWAVVGWAGAREIHVLGPPAARRHASSVPGSREMLALAPAALYAQLVVSASNPRLPPPLSPRRAAGLARWMWLFEGAGRYFGAQTEHARPAIARRLRDGGRPSFPPGLRDAALLGGTVLDLLAREQGIGAAVRLASELHPGGPREALVEAFGGRPLVHSEGAWRSHLARLAGAG